MFFTWMHSFYCGISLARLFLNSAFLFSFCRWEKKYYIYIYIKCREHKNYCKIMIRIMSQLLWIEITGGIACITFFDLCRDVMKYRFALYILSYYDKLLTLFKKKINIFVSWFIILLYDYYFFLVELFSFLASYTFFNYFHKIVTNS